MHYGQNPLRVQILLAPFRTPMCFWAAKLKRNLYLREIKSFEQTHTCDWLTKPHIVLSKMYDTYTTFTYKRLDESKEGRS